MLGTGFWHNLQTAAGMEGVFHWLVLAFVVAASILFVLVPTERVRIRAAVVLFACSFVGLLAAGALLSYGVTPRSIAYRWIRWVSLFFESVALINVASVIIFEVVLRGVRLRVPRIMRDLLLALAYLVAGIALLSRSGVNLAGIVATSAVITAVIGISMQDTLGNIMGGMALQLERSIKVGDWVRIGEQEGLVKEISWRQTSIETSSWDTIVIPNNVLTRSQVTILGRREGAPRQQRRAVRFNVDFQYAPTAVIDAVETALRAEPIPDVAREPEPHCLIAEFNTSYITYAARYWLADLAPADMADSVVRSRIYFALRRAGIPLSIPTQSIFLTEEDEMRQERKAREELDRRIGALERVSLFHTLIEDERRELAARLQVAPFGRGEAITRQGAEAHWLYIISKGVADVRVSVDGTGLSEKVATLREGDYFGEMGLMAGEPRTATVIAQTDVECYRLDKDAFDEILRRRPQIAEDVSHLLAQRRVELEAVREELNEEAMRQRMRYAEHDVLRRIRRFFSLDGGDGANT